MLFVCQKALIPPSKIFDYHITFVNFTTQTNPEGYFMIEKPVLDDGQKYFTSQQEFFKLK